MGGQNSTPKHRKAILNRPDSKKIRPPRKKKVKTSPKCVIVLSQPSMTQPCYVITNAPSSNMIGGTSTVITNSGLITNPLMSSKAAKTVSSMAPLGPGTLILANGTVMPIIPQQTVLPLASQIITRPPIILLSENNANIPGNTSQSKIVTSGVKTLARIKPKYCFTKTTQVNKVPIPALTSRYSNPEIVLKKSETRIIKAKVEKKVMKENEKKETTEIGEKRKVSTIEEDTTDAKKARIVKESSHKDDAQMEPKKMLSCESPTEKSKEEEKVKEADKFKGSVSKVNETRTVVETKKTEETLDLNISHSELSNDIFASLQVPAGCQNPESTSPTAAFLLAFPLVSSLTGVKVTEVNEEDNTESQRETPTLLQIGTMDNAKPTQSETLTPSLLNLDNLSFFSSKDMGGFYNSFDGPIVTTTTTVTTSTTTTETKTKTTEIQQKKVEYQHQQQPQQQHQLQPPLKQQKEKTDYQPQRQNHLSQQQQTTQSMQQQQPQTQLALQQQPQTQPPLQQQPQTQPPLQQQPQTQPPLQQQPQAQTPLQQRSQPQPQLQQQPQTQPPLQPPPQTQAPHQQKQIQKSLQQQTQPQLSLQQQHQSQQTIQQQQQQKQTRQQHQQSQSLQQQPQQSIQQTQLVPCFENHSMPTFGSANNYQAKPTGSLENKHQTRSNTYTQKTFTCNSFNETSKVATTCSFANNIKTYPEPLYTNSSNYTYSNPSETNFNQNYYKDVSKTDNRTYYSLNYENYADYKKNDSSNTYFPTNYYPNTNKFNVNMGTAPKKVATQIRPPINWMTTPDNRLQTPTEYVLPQFSKESDFYSTNTFTNTQTTYFNSYPTSTNEVAQNQESRKSFDLPLVPPVNTYQRNEVEDNQFSWSPTKIPQFLDPPTFVSSTLPTLVGDLALGNTLPFGEQRSEKCQKKDRRLKNYDGQSQNQGNFLSVSQLVDHNKEVVPARTTVRRNSGNRSSAKKVPQKSNHRKEKDGTYQNTKAEGSSVKGMKQIGYSSGSNEIFGDSSQKHRNATKNSYSAEALIGQMQSDHKRQNFNDKPISVSSFLHDNIIPYFPPVDLPQDNTYMQQNQNYQTTSFSHNFPSTFQSNTYTANTFIPTTTISSTYNFMHDVTHDYDLFSPMTKEKGCVKNVNKNVQCPTTPKKSKRKHSNELPGFVDFPFLSMPGTINSPILPDDFHTHTGFLQPPTPQLYPCKNPFTKSNELGSGSLLPLPPVPGTRSSIQHPEISPNINNAGTTLTNFNLSTIFPEINNKGGLDPYTEPRVKENPRSYTSSVQVTFNDKPTFSFSYINCTTSQSYNNQ